MPGCRRCWRRRWSSTRRVRSAPGRGVAALAGAVAFSLIGSTGAYASASVPFPSVFEPLCTPTDPGLAEQSGMTSLGDRIFAIGDSGNDEVILELDFDCNVHQRIPVPIDPYDIEDMGSHQESLILADTGDNVRARETVAVITVDPESGVGALHRLTYPDGAHDAESVLVDPSGQVFIVTKELFGPSGVYTPASGQSIAELAEPGPTPLTSVGTVATGDASTQGLNSVMVTGGAVSGDGSVLALRSYTDVYLYRIGADGIGAALTQSEPLRIPTPDQPQGESVTFTEAGDLVIGSEAGTGALPPLYILRGVVGSMIADDADTAADSGSNSRVGWGVWGASGIAAAVVVGGGLLVRARRSPT